MIKIKAGQEFYAVTCKGPHSRTLGGVEDAGKRIGPFRATRDSTSLGVQVGSRFFCPIAFKIIENIGHDYNEHSQIRKIVEEENIKENPASEAPRLQKETAKRSAAEKE